MTINLFKKSKESTHKLLRACVALSIRLVANRRGQVIARNDFLLAFTRLLVVRNTASHFVVVVLADMDCVRDRDATDTVVGVVGLVAASIAIVVGVAARQIVSRRSKNLGPVPCKDGFEGWRTGGQEGNVYYHSRRRKANSPGLVVVVGTEAPRVYDNTDNADDKDAITSQSVSQSRKAHQKLKTYIPPAPIMAKTASFCLRGIRKCQSIRAGMIKIHTSVKMLMPAVAKKK